MDEVYRWGVLKLGKSCIRYRGRGGWRSPGSKFRRDLQKLLDLGPKKPVLSVKSSIFYTSPGQLDR